MRTDEFWTDRRIWGPIIGALPEYRLSKFQRALPEEYSEEMVAGYLLDLPGASRVVGCDVVPALPMQKRKDGGDLGNRR